MKQVLFVRLLGTDLWISCFGTELPIVGENRERWDTMCRFTHHIRRALIIMISGSRKCCFVVQSNLYGDVGFGNATIVCSVCFMKNKNVFEKEKCD